MGTLPCTFIATPRFSTRADKLELLRPDIHLAIVLAYHCLLGFFEGECWSRSLLPTSYPLPFCLACQPDLASS